MKKVLALFPEKLMSSIVGIAKPENYVELDFYKSKSPYPWTTSHFKNVYKIGESYAENSGQTDNVKIINKKDYNEFFTLTGELQGQSAFYINILSFDNNSEGWTIEKTLSDISKTKDPIIIINNAFYLGGPLIDNQQHSNNWPTLPEIFKLLDNLLPDSYTTMIGGWIICVPKKLENLVNAYWIETFGDRFYEAQPEPRKRSFFERAISKSKKMLKKKPVKTESVAYNIRGSVWFDNELKKFKETHKWLQNHNFKAIIDIGANVGQFGKKIRQYYPDAKLYSFEPIPFVCDELNLNFKDDKNFEAINVGLGDSEGTTKFHLNMFSDSSSMLKMGDLHKQSFPYTKDEVEIDVTVKKLDNCFQTRQLEKPYLVKIDVQGFEEQVINGGTEVVKNADMIITEASYKELYEGQSLFDSIYEKLKGFGFEYIGNIEQMDSAFTGEPLQCDAVFQKKRD